MSMLEVALDPATVIVAVDPGKVFESGLGQRWFRVVGGSVSLPVLGRGISRLEWLLTEHAAV